MKKRKLLLHIFCFLTLLNIAILCNESIVFATDESVPTACSISINNDSSYANEKYVTLDIYAEDESDMQVWISNDGVTGTVTNFELGSTVTITDSDYVIGTALDSTNSTTVSNLDNIFRIENWPVDDTDGDGNKTVRVVFNDFFGNKTSIEAYETINITYNLNKVTGNVPVSNETLPGLGVYLPSVIAPFELIFLGWSTSNTATVANYYANTFVSFDKDVVLYAIFKEKPLINFTIDDVTYTAIDGMTLGEWVDSKYNTIGLYVYNNYLYSGEFVYISEYYGSEPYISLISDGQYDPNKNYVIKQDDEFYLYDSLGEWLIDSTFTVDGHYFTYRVFPHSIVWADVIIERYHSSGYPWYRWSVEGDEFVYNEEDERWVNNTDWFEEYIIDYTIGDDINDKDIIVYNYNYPDGNPRKCYLCYPDGTHVKYGESIKEFCTIDYTFVEVE